MIAASRRGIHPLPISQPPTHSKYRSRKVEVDGITFASKAESEYYQHLLLLQRAGEVERFVLQPSFELQPGFKKHGKTYRAITYVADFGVIWADGRREIIDVKGLSTPVFKIKQKMYSRLYDEPLILVAKKKGKWVYWS